MSRRQLSNGERAKQEDVLATVDDSSAGVLSAIQGTFCDAHRNNGGTSNGESMRTDPDLQTPPVEHVHSERILEIRQQVYNLQNRDYQLRMLNDRTREHARQYYAGDPAALRDIDAHLDVIFEDCGTAKSSFSAPRHLQELMSHTPCVFTMFPGLDGHETIAQYDLVLVDRFTTVRSRSEVSFEGKLTSSPLTSLSFPLLVANMRSSIGGELADVMVDEGLIPVFHRFRRPTNPMDVDTETPTVQTQEEADVEKVGWVRRYESRAFVSCGTKWDSIELTKRLIEEGAGGVCVDIALGNSAQAVATVIELKQFILDGGYSTQIIAGNVDTAEGYFMLALAGADAIKVGIGPGSPCTTRLVTRAGAGQGSALMDVARARFVLGPNAPTFIADGGMNSSSDFLLALALGASAGMVGRWAAVCEESGALKRDGKAWYFGEASRWARLYEGGIKPGMAVDGSGNWISLQGKFRERLADMKSGLYNAFPYYNSRTIEDLQSKYSIEQQLCDLIRGGTTGIHRASFSHSIEANTQLNP